MAPKDRQWYSLGTKVPAEIALQDAQAKDAEADAQAVEWTRVLSRLEALDVTPATRDLVERFTTGKLTIRQLDAAIDAHLRE